MRGKNINTMSTRRAVRPDADVYRQTRRLSRRKRSPAVTIAWGLFVFLLVAIAVSWWLHRHH
jgi:hypothetical protein